MASTCDYYQLRKLHRAVKAIEAVMGKDTPWDFAVIMRHRSTKASVQLGGNLPPAELYDLWAGHFPGAGPPVPIERVVTMPPSGEDC